MVEILNHHQRSTLQRVGCMLIIGGAPLFKKHESILLRLIWKILLCCWSQGVCLFVKKMVRVFFDMDINLNLPNILRQLCYMIEYVFVFILINNYPTSCCSLFLSFKNCLGS